jgi:hypothetical protein
MTLASEEHAARSSSSAESTAAWSRSERQAWTASIWPCSTSGSTVMMPPSSPSCSGEGSCSVKEFWPITFCSPRSIRPTRSRWDSTSRVFM